MKCVWILALPAALMAGLVAGAQQPGTPQLTINSSNRTLAVSADASVEVDPDLAILNIGFETQPTDAKSAYAEGARTSNAIIDAIKQAGIPESAIHSETQHLDRDFTKPHKFKLVQQWTVKVPPGRAAEILDIAISAGATSSGNIDWTVKDERALEEQALEQAAQHARDNAAVLARGMGVKLGPLVYASNQITEPIFRPRVFTAEMAPNASPVAPALSIEPNKVSRAATVYAVFAIE